MLLSAINAQQDFGRIKLEVENTSASNLALKIINT